MYVIRDLDDHELDRAIDARSAWELIEGRWRDAAVCGLSGPPVRGWMRMCSLLQEAEAAVVLDRGRAVGGVALEEDRPG